MQSKSDSASGGVTSTEESSYDVFVSYAREDNTSGWVTQIVDRLREARPTPSAPPLRVFFDTAEIRGMDDWQNRIFGAIRRSRVLLVCSSPAWAASCWCRRERSEFRKTRHERRNRVPESLAVVRLSDIAADDAVRDNAEIQEAIEDATRSQFLFDLEPWFADTRHQLHIPTPEAFAAWPLALEDLLVHLKREREAQRAQGNLRAGNRVFVGRKTALLGLHGALAHGKRRAHQVRDIGRSASADAAGSPSDAEGGGGAVLVILDNVDQPGLLSQAQLQYWPELNEGHEVIRLLATTRLGADVWQASAVEVLPLDRLPQEEALELMQRHREGLLWPDAAYESGVRALVTLLDGYTLLVEQVALYLARNPEVRPEALLYAFRKQGLIKGDALLAYDDGLEGAVRHREKVFAVVLDQTLSTLDGLPLARMALEYAAWLPPDHVPWEWLESLAREERPTDFDGPAYRPPPWEKAKRRLSTSQLLVDSGNGAARLHRLLGDHLRDRQREAASVDSTVVRAERIDKLAKERAAGLQHFYVEPQTAVANLAPTSRAGYARCSAAAPCL